MTVKRESEFEKAAGGSARDSKELLSRETEPPTPARDERTQNHRLLANLWLAARAWFVGNTFAPAWLPRRWRHPLVGYLVAVLLPVIIGTISVPLILMYPYLPHNLPLVLAVVVVALNWGMGPSLIATLVSALVLYYAVYSPQFTWVLANEEDLAALALFLIVALTISALASQKERARRDAGCLAREAEQARQEAEGLMREAEQARQEAEELAASLAREQARSEQERHRLQAVLDVLPVGVFIADPAGRLLEINPAARAIWGQDAPLAAEIGQYGIYQGWWPDTGQRLAPEEWALARTLLTGEEVLDEEVEIESFDGQRKTITNFTVPILNEAGATAGGVVAVLDISERKRLEEALRQSERAAAARASQLEAFFESMVDSVAVYDTEGYALRMNAAGYELFGMEASSPDALLPATERFSRLKPRDEHGQPISGEQWPIRRMLRGEVLVGASAPDVTITNLRGRELEVNISGAPVRDADGRIVGAISVLRDVTERRRLERRTREALNALVAMAEVLVAVPEERSDPEESIASAAGRVAERLAELTSKVLGCQRISASMLDAETGRCQALAMLGLSPEQEQHWWAGECVNTRLLDGSLPALSDRLAAGETLVLDMAQPPLNSEPNLYHTSVFLAVPMRIGERLVGLLTLDYADGTHQYTAEEIRLAEAVAKLGALVIERERLLHEREAARASALAREEANRQMDAFLSMVSHELKNPLASIMLGLQLARRRLARLSLDEAGTAGELAEKQKAICEALERTDRQALQMDRLVNDLLEVSRIQVGRLALHMEQTDLAAIVREVVEEQRSLAHTRAIRLHLPSSPLPRTQADPGRIRQVVTNYLTNALKYSAEDRPVEVGLEYTGSSVRVWVRDEGPGLPPEEHARIWERFHRVPGIEVQSGSGVGLGVGLHISKTLIERHHGQVGVQSAPGQGSTFWFALPLVSAGSTASLAFSQD